MSGASSAASPSSASPCRGRGAIGNFAYGIEHGGLLYLSGTTDGGRPETRMSYQSRQARRRALDRGRLPLRRLMAVNHLAMAKAVLGDLDRIIRVIRLLGFVNSAAGFRARRAC